MGLIDWMVTYDPSVRVLVGFALCVLGLLLGIMRLSFVRGWSAQPPAPRRTRHVRRWYGIRNGQESAARILARLEAERRPVAEPAGVPHSIWWDEPTWPTA